MAKEILHESLFGYSKKDVNKYIADLSNQYSVKSNEYKNIIGTKNEEINNLDKKCSELSDAQTALNEENAELKKQLSEQKAEFEKLSAEYQLLSENNNKIKEENETLKALSSEANQKLDSLAEEIYILQQSNKSDKGNILYADLEAKVNNLLAYAEEQAHRTVEEAKQQANEITENANIEKDRILEDANIETEKIRSVFKNAAAEYYSELLQYSEELKYALAAFTQDITNKSKELSEKIDYMRLDAENISRNKGIVEGEYEKQDDLESSEAQLTDSSQLEKLELKSETLIKRILDSINNIIKGSK